MFNNLLDKFYKKIYKLDKSMNDEDGKETPDFDTWMEDLKKEKSIKDRLKDEVGPGKNARKISKKEFTRSSKKNQDKLKEGLQRKYAKGLREYKDKKVNNDKKTYKKDYIKENEIKDELREDGLKKAIIYREILSKPKGRRWVLLIFFFYSEDIAKMV